MKRLHRSKNNKIIAGICGGIGEYFDKDPVLIRLMWVVVVLLSGVFPGVVAYLVAYFIIPEEK